MIRTLASALSFLLVGSAAKSCCNPDGHCKDESDPTRSDQSKECKQIAIEHSSFLDHSLVPTMVPSFQLAMPSVVRVAPVSAFDSAESSPPDRQALYSTFLV